MAKMQEFKCPCCGGSIEFDSSVQKMKCPFCDTEFDVGTLSEYAQTVEEEQPEEEVSGVLTGKKILVAEDNELNMEVTKFILESAGATVVLVENGERCVKEFRASEEGEFDAVLMDIMMPIMDGLEATACIRALEREDAMTVPIIAMTAKAFVDDRQKSFAAGMNEHLAKPLEAKEIIKTLVKFVVQD